MEMVMVKSHVKSLLGKIVGFEAQSKNRGQF